MNSQITHTLNQIAEDDMIEDTISAKDSINYLDGIVKWPNQKTDMGL